MSDHGDKSALLRHLRTAHPNLFSGHSFSAGEMRDAFRGRPPDWFPIRDTPLPNAGASDFPIEYLLAVHAAAHCERSGAEPHTIDDWTYGSPRRVEVRAQELHAESYPNGPQWINETEFMREHYLKLARQRMGVTG